MRRIGLIFGAVCLVAASVTAQPQQSRGILDLPAPKWSVDKWINLPRGASKLDIHDFRGKVLYLYCFQSWCPGCHAHGFPTLQKVIPRFADNPDVAFVAIQTVFEGFSSNTFEHAKKVAKQYHLDIPIGQSGENGQRSTVMNRYRTGGTPWTIIIDRDGVVRYNDFRIEAEQAGRVLNELLAKPRRGHAKAKLPRTITGRELIGQTLPLKELTWLNTPGKKPIEVEGKVTLVRWWTDTCPFCEDSLPAISKLKHQYGPQGFQTVAVYHPKPPRDVPARDIINAAAAFSYDGPIAVDAGWETLDKFYLSTKKRFATSVSFLLDRRGKVRFVHPGPALYPSDDLRNREIHRDYLKTKMAIEALLAE